MKRFLSYMLSAASLALILVSCAKNVKEDEYYSSDKVLASWVKSNYGDVPQDTAGVYILSFEEGSGHSATDSSYAFVDFVAKTTAMEVAYTSRADILEKAGQLSYATYCGNRIWRLGQGYLPNGVERVIRRMKEGGRALIAVSVRNGKVTTATYPSFSQNENRNLVYDITVNRFVEDIRAYQDSLLKAYSLTHYGGVDSLINGYYLVKTGSYPEADTLAEEESVGIRYVGRRLDDVVFDTNIRDTASRYKLSSASSDTLSVKFYKDSIKMVSSNNYISGMTYAVNKMRHRDTLVVFFRSDYGYGETGSGTSIPEYCPLCFKIYIQENFGAQTDDEEDYYDD